MSEKKARLALEGNLIIQGNKRFVINPGLLDVREELFAWIEYLSAQRGKPLEDIYAGPFSGGLAVHGEVFLEGERYAFPFDVEEGLDKTRHLEPGRVATLTSESMRSLR